MQIAAGEQLGARWAADGRVREEVLGHEAALCEQLARARLGVVEKLRGSKSNREGHRALFFSPQRKSTRVSREEGCLPAQT